MTASVMIGIATLIVTLLLAVIAYLIRGMMAAGKMTETVSTLVAQVAGIQETMLTAKDLDNAILKFKLEIMREAFSRQSDKQ